MGYITGLSPFGPIFGKELRVASRRRRNHALRVGYLGALALILMAFYASILPNRNYSQTVAMRMQEQAELGRVFFVVFSVFCICCMGLIAPVLTSTAINSERLGKTLGVLLMTPITSWQIVSGKLFARLLICFLLIGLSLPVLALVRLLGGAEVSQMCAILCLTTSFALSCGAIGLFFSTFINRTYAAILMSYAALFVVYFLIPTFALTMSRGSPGVMMAVMASNPVVNVVFVVIPEAFIMTGNPLMQWLPGVLIQLGLTLFLLILSAAMIRRISRKADERATGQPALPPLPESADLAGAAPGRKSAMVGDNPVLWRETRKPLSARINGPILGLVVIAVLLISYAVFASSDALDERELHGVYGVMFNGLYWLLCTVLAATAIAQEKESDTWTLLLATPLSGDSVVMGKLLGIIRRLLWPTVLVALHFMIFAFAGIVSFKAMLVVIWVIVSFNSIWIATGLFLSLYVRKVTTAVVINLMLAIILYGALSLVLLIIGEVIGAGEGLVEIWGFIIPYPFIASAVDSFSPYRSGLDQKIWLPNNERVDGITFMGLVGAIGLLHILLATVVLFFTIAKFDVMEGRAPQKHRKNPDLPQTPPPLPS